MKNTTVRLDGYSLTIDALMLLGTGDCRIELTKEAITGVLEARKVFFFFYFFLIVSGY
jgi:hypothetical protein